MDALPLARGVIDDGISAGLHVGAQVYVSREGVPLADEAIGASFLPEDGDVSLDPEHLVLWLSATKPIGAIAIAQLWEQDKLDLDAPIAEVIPEFGVRGKAPISMRHILTHTGGFRTADLSDPTLPWDELVQRVCDSPLEDGWVIGETAGYHDRPSWYVLAEVVQRIDKRPYRDYVCEEIFAPLRMMDSWVGMHETVHRDYGSRIAGLYDTAGGAQRLTDWHREPYCTMVWPAGGGRGPMGELGALYEMLLHGGALNGARILDERTVVEFTRRHRVGAFDTTFQHTMDWGLGFILDSKRYGMQTVPYGYGRHCSEETFGHGGRQSVGAFADPKYELVVAVAFNGTPGEPRHNKRIRDFATAVYVDLGLDA